MWKFIACQCRKFQRKAKATPHQPTSPSHYANFMSSDVPKVQEMIK
jgi:hypothetical protein